MSQTSTERKLAYELGKNAFGYDNDGLAMMDADLMKLIKIAKASGVVLIAEWRRGFAAAKDAKGKP